MVISLTCQRLLLRTYALGADKCTTQYNQPKNTFAENCALDNAQAEVVQLCIRLCLPLSFVVLHAMLFLDQWMNFWRMWFHMCSCPLHRFFWLFSSSKLLHCPGMASLTAWSLAHKRSTGEPGGASKKQAGGSEKFLMKGGSALGKIVSQKCNGHPGDPIHRPHDGSSRHSCHTRVQQAPRSSESRKIVSHLLDHHIAMLGFKCLNCW